MVENIHKAQRGGGIRKRTAGLLLAFLVMSTMGLRAQFSPFDTVWTTEASQIREKVECFTDRSLYIVEELISFSAFLTHEGPTGPGSWSTVLYVELISMDGTRLAGSKFPVHKQHSSGDIRIPANLLSGNYYLRAYTRWMRNWGPESFTYLPIRIVNPHRAELYPVPVEQPVPNSPMLHDASVPTLQLFKSEFSFSRGDSVMLDLLIQGGDMSDSLEGVLTVVPRAIAPSGKHFSKPPVSEDFHLDFLPDRFGPSLSGSVKPPREATHGLEQTVIHLSLMGGSTGYFVCRSDAMGKFNVGLPTSSRKLEIFVQAENPDMEALEVRIDQDFDPRQVQLPGTPFRLREKEIKWATIMARNVQLSGLYEHIDTLGRQLRAEEIPAFYGTPSFTVDLDQYVLLPTLREVFLNLVPSVTPITRKGKPSLQIESVNPSLYLYETLVMVDQVPVLDVEQFMSMSPAKIKRIDVIEDVYVKGDLRFGGIINLHSRDGDMAGIDLPDNSFFIDYQGMEPVEGPPQISADPDDKYPDMRNTFLYLPEYTLPGGKPVKLSFIAPQYPGEYVVLFRGYNIKGELIQAEGTFEVR